VNKEQKHSEVAEGRSGYPADPINIHSFAQMLNQNQQNCNCAQEIKVSGKTWPHK